MRPVSNLGVWVGKLPKGCELCMRGLKSVLFITGLCRDKCFYCPISPLRKRRDVTYINEVKVNDLKDLILEVDASGSKGVGVTGGDPIACAGRTIKFIKELKDFYGSKFHIHLYTSGTMLSDEVMSKLVNAGLDEIRIHIISEKSWEALRIAKRYSIKVGIENPALPKSLGRLKKMVLRAIEEGADFINLNELEVSDSNRDELLLRGFKISSNGISVKGSEEVAVKIIEWIREEGIKVNMHYCPARFKDVVQLSLRLSLRGKRTKLPYEVLDDGLVRWAELVDAPVELVVANLCFRKGDTLLSNPSLARRLGITYRLIEAHPTTPRRVLNVSLIQ